MSSPSEDKIGQTGQTASGESATEQTPNLTNSNSRSRSGEPSSHAAENRYLNQRPTSVGKRATSRPMLRAPSSPRMSLGSQVAGAALDPSGQYNESIVHVSKVGDENLQHSLLARVYDWLQHEKSKLAAEKQMTARSQGVPGALFGDSASPSTQQPSSSPHSERALALDELERILVEYSVADRQATAAVSGRKRSPSSLKRLSTRKVLKQGSTSDSDYVDVDLLVPSADVVLDNSRTLHRTSSESGVNPGKSDENKSASKGEDNWRIFKSEILRLIHTLGLKRWRRIPLENGSDIDVERLSGALTNAVYVVSPPKNLPHTPATGSSSSPVARKPPKLLLRIYGPQAERLIDREYELQILRRLRRRNIGPCLLGIFNNGRFEEYLHAKPLTAQDLHIPETSIQIAKRMRELHDGIELLEEEREGGPFVWKNWDKWVDRCEQVTSWLDNETLLNQNEANSRSASWRRRGFVCGVKWPVFRKAVDAYRKWLDARSGGAAAIKKRLIFAHNDTQYGNVLRLEPSGESPLLLPLNEHKQLVVIDFEYASANTRELEFANHFSEWCYNYHHAEKPWACNTKWYPKPEEQDRFIRAYLNHQPHPIYIAGSPHGYLPSSPSTVYPTSTSSGTTMRTPPANMTYTSSPRVAPFDLDSEVPPLQDPSLHSEQPRDQSLEMELQRLRRETRLWRVANSAQWVAWGILQAKIPGMEDAARVAANDEAQGEQSQPADQSADGHAAQGDVDDLIEEFDYLAYARDRALFFWADFLSLGFIQEDELPAEMVEHLKTRMIDY